METKPRPATKQENTTPEQTQQRVSQRVIDQGRKVVKKTVGQLEQLQVEYVPVESVGPNTYNPNRQSPRDFDLLIRSITEDGFTQPIIVHRESRQIVDGEHRWRAAKQMGMKEIPAVLVSMPDEQMRLSTLRHNRARGTEDFDLSAEVLRDLQKLGAIEWAADSLMIGDTELNNILGDATITDMLASEEYSEAWVPDKEGNDSDAVEANGVDQSVQRTEKIIDNGETLSKALSRKAAEQLQGHAAAVGAATTEDEKRTLISDQPKSYRLNLIFAGTQATLVREVLGDEPAENLLGLLRSEQSQTAQAG